MPEFVVPFIKTLARWRTYIVNSALAFVMVAPDLISSPELLAVIPEGWQKWAIAVGFLLNIWMRPRPAVLPSDPEAVVSKVIKDATMA